MLLLKGRMKSFILLGLVDDLIQACNSNKNVLHLQDQNTLTLGIILLGTTTLKLEYKG